MCCFISFILEFFQDAVNPFNVYYLSLYLWINCKVKLIAAPDPFWYFIPIFSIIIFEYQPCYMTKNIFVICTFLHTLDFLMSWCTNVVKYEQLRYFFMLNKVKFIASTYYISTLWETYANVQINAIIIRRKWSWKEWEMCILSSIQCEIRWTNIAVWTSIKLQGTICLSYFCCVSGANTLEMIICIHAT